VSGATFTVTKTADTADGTCDADCSLREAVIAANALAGADTIVVPAGTYVLTLVGANEDASATGDLDITDLVTLNGAGAATTIIDGNATDRVFHITSAGTNFTVTGVTIRNGRVAGFGGGINKEGAGFVQITSAVVTANVITSSGFGGGINNNDGAAFNIDLTTVSNNTTGGFGGGINNNLNGALTVRDSTVSGNSATGFGGGGINNNSSGTLLVTRSTISGNSAQNGGGVSNNFGGIATITFATISGNTATGNIGGGGILNNSSGRLNLYVSTVSGNASAGFGGGGLMSNSTGQLDLQINTISGNTTTGSNGGGGIYQNSTPTIAALISLTIADNSSTNGGANLHINSGQTPLTVLNTIIANPVGGPNCGTLGPTSNGFNLASDASCNLAAAGDAQNANPLLGPLANNGGLTQTHGLTAGSPAIDTGSPAVSPGDQRGVARPVGAGFDKGAFEGTISAPPPPAVATNIPTLSEWTLMALSLLLGTAALTTLRRRGRA
jgi:CSLREA domain-containing protein